MVYSFLFLIFFILCILCFYTHKVVISLIRLKRKYNIQTNTSSVNIFTHIIIYTLGIIDISICVWALFNI